MPQYEGTAVLTVGKFDAARKVVTEWLGSHGYDLATPYKPGHEGPMWVLSLEGYEDWAIRITNDESVTWPPGVFAEPVSGWCLGLYPAPDRQVTNDGQGLAQQWETAVAQGNEWAKDRIGARMAEFLRNQH